MCLSISALLEVSLRVRCYNPFLLGLAEGGVLKTAGQSSWSRKAQCQCLISTSNYFFDECVWGLFLSWDSVQSSVFPFLIDNIVGKLVNHMLFSQYALKPFSVLCFASYFPVVYTSNLFSMILNIWFHNYFSFTMCTVVSPGLLRVSSCPSTLCFLCSYYLC